MIPVGFEPTSLAGERPQTDALDLATTGTGNYRNTVLKFIIKREASEISKHYYKPSSTDMRCLTTGIRSEKCVVRRFRRANVIECTYTNLDSIAYYIHASLNDGYTF